MCTLIALHRCIPGAPLVVAANRDEFHERPTEGPALRENSICSSATPKGPGVKIVAPRDLRAGGTWLGVNASGVFAAVTNRRCEEPDATRRSRGWLVLEALAETTARGAAQRLEALPEAAYNPFNLFLADRVSAHLVSYAERPECRDLEAGTHVIGNVHPDEPSPKIERLRREVEDWASRERPSLDALGDVCRSHAGGLPLEATCVHAGPYGTRSSTLLRIGDAPSLRYSDGPPCEAPYRDLTPLLHDLGLVRAPERVQARG